MEHSGTLNGHPSGLTLTFVLSRNETIACYRRLAFRKWSSWAFVAFGLAVAVFGWSVAAAEFVVAGLTFSLVYVLLTFAIQPASMWRRNPELHHQQVIRLSSDGVTSELENRHSTADWTFWTRSSRIGDMYVLQAESRGYCVIPTRSLSADDPTRLETLLEHETQTTLS